MRNYLWSDGWPTPASDHHLLKLASLKGRHRKALNELRAAETKEEMKPIRIRILGLANEIREVSRL